ncbi:DUF488 domain-containing protein [Thermogemmatispora onikobensis]|uniref:DUF488 domain-containing protein n=1 Tax=Thermogemmatispora onikobensis TaxID=732234 RepID=UPI00085345C5|nr:DUF488 family protein [Thermogemmatispora onikobensis]
MSGETLRVQLKRVYEEPLESDGTRVLVERLWPRGLSRERARIDLWLKDVAPSDELRRWFAHDPQKFPEFRRRYEQELRDQETARAALARLLELARQGPLTLVYSARDREHNNAVVLRDLLGRGGFASPSSAQRG